MVLMIDDEVNDWWWG